MTQDGSVWLEDILERLRVCRQLCADIESLSGESSELTGIKSSVDFMEEVLNGVKAKRPTIVPPGY